MFLFSSFSPRHGRQDTKGTFPILHHLEITFVITDFIIEVEDLQH